ncbi:MAG: aminopeptidase, partial [Bacteroidota bacterium]|nr:aminopeptidase [Bacteroidota bacterium]
MKVLAVVILALLNLTLHAQRQDLESSKGDLHLYKDERAGAQNNYNLTYQRLELNVDPAVNYIAGKITSIFIPDAAMSYIEFDLLDTLKVDSVYYHNVSIPFVHSGNIVHITFPANVSAGQQDSVSVYYQGKPSTGNGFGSFEQTTHGRDSVPIIWTLSEPY